MLKLIWDLVQTIRRNSYFFIILIFLLSACSPLSQLPTDSQETIPPQPTIDPWISAIEQVDQILITNPDFENHIYSYLDTAAEINQHLVLIEHAKPALDLADQLKNTDIPLMGNAWEILVETLDTSFTGSGQALIIVDSGLRQLMAFKGDLDSLSALTPVASASETFRVAASPDNLRGLDHSIFLAKPSLITVDQSLYDQIQKLDEFIDNIAIVQQGLSLAGSFADIPIIGEAVIIFNQSINEVASPIVEIRDAGLDLHNRIQSDLSGMESIQDIVYLTENPPSPGEVPQQTTSSIIQSLDSVFGEWTAMLLIGITALLLMGGFLFWMSMRTKKSLVTTSVTDSISPPLAPYVEQQEAAPPPVIAPQISHASLEIIHGQMAGRSIPLTGNDLLIGRGSACDVQISDPAVSRRQARLRHAEGTWFIQDQGSSSATFVNGQQVQAGRLKSGDRIVIGNTQMTFLVD